MCLRDVREPRQLCERKFEEPMRFELPLTIFDVLYVSALINVYMSIKEENGSGCVSSEDLNSLIHMDYIYNVFLWTFWSVTFLGGQNLSDFI